MYVRIVLMAQAISLIRIKNKIIMLDLILRIFIAGVLGGLIGLEREYRGKAAGFRTHFLVALGSALFMVLSMYGFDEALTKSNVSYDPSRIASQIVTGIGFIGAGAIIFQKRIHGLTTAAGVWVTAAIGMTCGSSLYLLAVATTIIVLICLEAEWFFKRLNGKDKEDHDNYREEV